MAVPIAWMSMAYPDTPVKMTTIVKIFSSVVLGEMSP